MTTRNMEMKQQSSSSSHYSTTLHYTTTIIMFITLLLQLLLLPLLLPSSWTTTQVRYHGITLSRERVGNARPARYCISDAARCVRASP